MLHDKLNTGGPCTLSRFDNVGVDVRLRARLTDPADEDMNFAEGDPVPILDCAGLGALACVVDVELAGTTLGHPPHGVSLEPYEVAL